MHGSPRDFSTMMYNPTFEPRLPSYLHHGSVDQDDVTLLDAIPSHTSLSRLLDVIRLADQFQADAVMQVKGG